MKTENLRKEAKNKFFNNPPTANYRNLKVLVRFNNSAFFLLSMVGKCGAGSSITVLYQGHWLIIWTGDYKKRLLNRVERELNPDTEDMIDWLIDWVIVQENDEKRLLKGVERELNHEVEDMIEDAQKLLTGHPNQVEDIVFVETVILWKNVIFSLFLSKWLQFKYST